MDRPTNILVLDEQTYDLIESQNGFSMTLWAQLDHLILYNDQIFWFKKTNSPFAFRNFPIDRLQQIINIVDIEGNYQERK